MLLVQRLFLPVCALSVCVCVHIHNSACVGMPWHGCRPTHAKAHTTPSMYSEESSDLVDKIECQELLDTFIHTHTQTHIYKFMHIHTPRASPTQALLQWLCRRVRGHTRTHTRTGEHFTARIHIYITTYPYLYYSVQSPWHTLWPSLTHTWLVEWRDTFMYVPRLIHMTWLIDWQFAIQGARAHSFMCDVTRQYPG